MNLGRGCRLFRSNYVGSAPLALSARPRARALDTKGVKISAVGRNSRYRRNLVTSFCIEYILVYIVSATRLVMMVALAQHPCVSEKGGIWRNFFSPPKTQTKIKKSLTSPAQAKTNHTLSLQNPCTAYQESPIHTAHATHATHVTSPTHVTYSPSLFCQCPYALDDVSSNQTLFSSVLKGNMDAFSLWTLFQGIWTLVLFNHIFS